MNDHTSPDIESLASLAAGCRVKAELYAKSDQSIPASFVWIADEIERIRAVHCSAGIDGAARALEPIVDVRPSADIVEKLERIADAAIYPDGGDSPLSQQIRQGIKEICELRDMARILKDPIAVHVNMLRGSIAKPTWSNIKHLYPEEFTDLAQAAWKPDRDAIYRAIESNVRSEPDKHFIDRRWMAGINDAVDAILALSSTDRGDK